MASATPQILLFNHVRIFFITENSANIYVEMLCEKIVNCKPVSSHGLSEWMTIFCSSSARSITYMQWSGPRTWTICTSTTCDHPTNIHVQRLLQNKKLFYSKTVWANFEKFSKRCSAQWQLGVIVVVERYALTLILSKTINLLMKQKHYFTLVNPGELIS